MLDLNNRVEQCNVCGYEYTSIHAEVMPGLTVYVCESCLEAAKYNFIFICMNCGKVHVIPKMKLIRGLHDKNLKMTYMEYLDEQIIYGIDMCMFCDPEGILNYMDPGCMEC